MLNNESYKIQKVALFPQQTTVNERHDSESLSLVQIEETGQLRGVEKQRRKRDCSVYPPINSGLK